MSDIQVYETLQTNLVSFLDELIEIFPNEGDFVLFRIMVKDRIPIIEIAKYMEYYLLPEKDAVKIALKSAINGNPAPFNSKLNDMFNKFAGKADNDNVGYVTNYKQLFDSLDDDNRVAIWKWLHVFIHLLEKINKK